MPSVDVRAWRALIGQRQRLVELRVRVKNQLRALLRGQGLAAPKGLWPKQGRPWLAAVELPTAVDRLRTILGVGPRTAKAVVEHLDDPHRFASAK